MAARGHHKKEKGNLWAPKIANLSVTPRVPDPAPFVEMFGCALPLCKADATVELRGVPTAAVNALRRVLIDEMTGVALQVPKGGFRSDLSSERFMLEQMVVMNIELIPLWQAAAAALVGALQLELKVENATAAARVIYAGDLRVAAGALPAPIFNPTFAIAVLQPGKTLVVEGISVAAGRGAAPFHVACRAAYRHLDLAQHSDAAVRLEEGDTSGAAPVSACDASGYLESSLVADPRAHELRLTLPATTEGTAAADVRAVIAAAAADVRARLRAAADAVAGAAGDAGGAGAARFRVAPGAGGRPEATLVVPGETHTVGELLRRAVCDTHPEVAFAAHTVYERRLTLTVRADDPAAVLAEAAAMAIEAFDEIHRAALAL